MFFGNNRWRVYKIWKTIANLNKIIETTNIILQIPNEFANPPIVAKSRKIFANPKKYFADPKNILFLAPAVSQRQSLFSPICSIMWVNIFYNVSLLTLEYGYHVWFEFTVEVL